MSGFSDDNSDNSWNFFKEELLQLKNEIPVFASWRIGELKEIVNRYERILNAVCEHEPYDSLCKTMVESLEGIKRNIDEAMKSRNWVPYNRAATELIWDLENLLDLLPVS